MRDDDRPTLLEPDPAEQDVAEAIAEAREVMRSIGAALDQLTTDTLDLEVWLEALAALGRAQRDLQAPAKIVGKALGVTSAKQRMLEYLLLHEGEVVDNYSLAGVAGTLEWARRVRELQLEEGWNITAGPDGGLKSGEYRLNAPEADDGRAEEWRIRNQVRRMDGSGQLRLLKYLQRVFPAAASKEDLAYVSRINEWPRRMRELAEAGWLVVSCQDDPTLPPGTYRLDALMPGAPRERRAIAQRHSILERDNWTCQRCGASPQTEPGTRLQIHHKRFVSAGGGNDDKNLITVCVECHLGIHSSETDTTWDELLDPTHDPWLDGRPEDTRADVDAANEI